VAESDMRSPVANVAESGVTMTIATGLGLVESLELLHAAVSSATRAPRALSRRAVNA